MNDFTFSAYPRAKRVNAGTYLEQAPSLELGRVWRDTAWRILYLRC